MFVNDNGIIRELTDDEIQPDYNVTELLTDISTATTIAQIRNACKKFLEVR